MKINASPNGTRRGRKEKEFHTSVNWLDSRRRMTKKNFKLYNPNVNIYLYKKKQNSRLNICLEKEFFIFCLLARKRENKKTSNTL